MKITKLVLVGLFAFAMMIGAFAAKPATAAPFHATSFGMVSAGNDGASYWHHHHHHHRHVGVSIHL